ncbi:hypothetical protein [Allocoleopsis franciscana]|uniref:hypothetical protein n=1 Tax=Allocoleopsis franciscana TaxID=2886352 RepID=UPI0002F3BFC6|nr:hypothetical protein [Allocoleopsis franciscana]
MRVATFEILKLPIGDGGKIRNLKCKIKNGMSPGKGEEMIMSSYPDFFNYGNQIIRELGHNRAEG